MIEMTEQELRVLREFHDRSEPPAARSFEPVEILIGCAFSAITSTWPKVFKHLGRVYTFDGQEPLGDYAGDFAGCAKYVLRREYECYLMDPSKKMAHIEGEPLYASDNLGFCSKFVYEKFQENGVPIGV